MSAAEVLVLLALAACGSDGPEASGTRQNAADTTFPAQETQATQADGVSLSWVTGPAGRLRVADTGPPVSARDPSTRTGPPGSGSRGFVPVVFVHALAGSHLQWAAQLRALKGDRRAVALDLRGNGESELPSNGDFTVAALARDVAAVVDSLKLARFVLVGHSLGGAAVAEYAGLHPDRVAGLLFVDPVGDQRLAQDELIQFLFQLDQDYRSNIEAYWSSILEGSAERTREIVMSDLGRAPQEAVVHSMEALLYFDPVAALSRYEGPMLSVITPQNNLPLSLHNLIPDIRTVTVEGTSHWLQMDKPAAFQRILEGFLEEVDGAEPAASESP